jgi:plastocyanin
MRHSSPRIARRGAVLAAALLCAATSLAARAESVTGTVRLLDHGARAADLADAVVWWESDARGPKAAPSQASIDTRNRQFAPRTLVVAPGSTVRFPNADPIRHNVFSVSPANRFDLGLYGQGTGRVQRFDRPGLVRVFCNVHRQMAAWVLVLETPHHARVAADGSFALRGIPAGPGTLHVWHPRATAWTSARVPPDDAVTVELDATLPPVPQHLDKFGRPYPETPDDGPYR